MSPGLLRAELRSAWATMTPVRRATTVMVASLIMLGVALRVQRLGVPSHFTFDEELFARPAFGYLMGHADGNDHPPLGKLLIAVGILLFGPNPVGFRFASLVFGLYTLVVVKWLGTALFRSQRAGWFACAAFAADGFFIGYSRCGLMDGVLVCFVLFAFLAAVTARTPLQVASSALLVGLATSIKWSGAFAVFPAAAAVLAMGQVPRWSVLLFGVAPLVHVGIWLSGLALTGQPSNLPALFELMVSLFKHHQELGSHDNGLASPWYSWMLMWHPIVVKLSPHGIGSTYASTVSNPALWAAATICLLFVPGAAVVSKVRTLLGRAPLLDGERLRPMLLAWLGWLSLLAPWMVGRGKFTFHYHYLPSFGFALLLVAGGGALLEKKHAEVVLAVVALSLGLAVYFAPVWGELTLSEQAANARLVFPNWKP